MTLATILIVEDDFIVARTLERTLTGLGYHVVGMTSTGESAIEMIGSCRPSLVLLDIQLGGHMDGIETAQKINELFHIPVVYLTAYSDDQTFARAIDTALYGYLIKPVSTNALRTTIEVALEKYRIEESLRQANRKLNLLSSITRHDILNTLTALMAAVDLALMTAEEPAFIRHLEEEAQLLARIQRQIEFARDYENLGAAAPVWHDLGFLVTATAQQVVPAAIRVETAVQGIRIFADPLFEKVIYNLLDNAVRHGGGVTILRFVGGENDTGFVLVCTDNGAGISPDEKSRIFERGYGKNTGLGLFLAREILAITGFTIHETGKLGEGARFEIHIPKGSYRTSGE